MLNVSRPGPPPTIAELIEALQKLPPEMRCTNVLTEWEPSTYKHIPLEGATARVKARMDSIAKITITLESWSDS